jgi:NitT/TauT family transport system permease protein
VAWLGGSHILGTRLLPEPQTVWLAIVQEARSGALAFNLSVTLVRVAVAFTIAMLLGTAIGLAMGRVRLFDQVVDPWLIELLNLPALVIIVLAYVWAGLTETAAIAAVVLNKLPIATVTVREGARALDPALDEMATAFRMGGWARLRHVILPQLTPPISNPTPLGRPSNSTISAIFQTSERPERAAAARYGVSCGKMT